MGVEKPMDDDAARRVIGRLNSAAMLLNLTAVSGASYPATAPPILRQPPAHTRSQCTITM